MKNSSEMESMKTKYKEKLTNLRADISAKNDTLNSLTQKLSETEL
jgi:Skp family chaperone for outer membrane proteins